MFLNGRDSSHRTPSRGAHFHNATVLCDTATARFGSNPRWTGFVSHAVRCRPTILAACPTLDPRKVSAVGSGVILCQPVSPDSTHRWVSSTPTSYQNAKCLYLQGRLTMYLGLTILCQLKIQVRGARTTFGENSLEFAYFLIRDALLQSFKACFQFSVNFVSSPTNVSIFGRTNSAICLPEATQKMCQHLLPSTTRSPNGSAYSATWTNSTH